MAAPVGVVALLPPGRPWGWSLRAWGQGVHGDAGTDAGLRVGGTWGAAPLPDGDLTKTLGVSRASLAYYERAGLVSPTRDPQTGVREYDNKDVFDLFEYMALGNLGLTARQVVARAASYADLFDEERLEDYLSFATGRIAYYEALRDSVDRMRLIRERDRLGPLVRREWVERYVFVDDGAEDGYYEFRSSDELDLLAACFPIAGFGIRFGLDDEGRTTWRWGRTIPTRHAHVAGLRRPCPNKVGGCTCLTMVGRTFDDQTPLAASLFDPLYKEARQQGLAVKGDPFVPYIFPPHTGTPYIICLPLDDNCG